MISRPLDIDEVADILGAVAAQVGRHLSPDIARRIEAVRAEIAVAVVPKSPRRQPPAPRSVEQWA